MEIRSVAFLLSLLGISICYDNISKNCTVAQSTTYGCNVCTHYLPSNAVDGNTSTCTRTDWFGSESYYMDKTAWWYVDLGDIKSVSSIGIQFRNYSQYYEMRQRGRMAGFSLYLSNTSNIEDGYLCYKDGPDLPPLDFNTTCVNHGRYVIFYNERIQGAHYPANYETRALIELCEVIILGCLASGRYGQDCDLICPSTCQEQRCHIVDGTCLGCSAGWTGKFCDKACPQGYFGMECKFQCRGHCRNGVSCNHTSGICDNGCGDGWHGVQCDQECKDGKYGPNCIYTCSDNCLKNVTCDKTNGKCQGCKPGYTGNRCDHTCPGRFYGQNCSTACNENCIDEGCHHKTGLCSKGCKAGYQGLFCNEKCPLGLFGANCEQWCSPYCAFNDTCDRRNGSCPRGCQHPFEGSSCDYKVLFVTKDSVCSCKNSHHGYIAVIVVLIVLNLCTCGVFMILRRRYTKKEEKPSSLYTTYPAQQTTSTDDTNAYLELHAVTNDNSYQNLSFT